MRFVLSLAALATLAACATAPAAAPIAPAEAPRPATTAGSSRALQLLSAAGHANAPTRADIERTFGTADIARQDGAGAALTYRLDTCALLLLFEADTHNALRLSEAHVSPRQPGNQAPSLDQCAAEASARRRS